MESQHLHHTLPIVASGERKTYCVIQYIEEEGDERFIVLGRDWDEEDREFRFMLNNHRENCPNTSQYKKIAPRDRTQFQIPPSTSPHVNNSVVYFTKLINLLLYFTNQFSLLLYLTNSLSVFSFVSPIKIDCYFTSRNVSCCWSPHQ